MTLHMTIGENIMDFIRTIFWNSDEARLRMVWRFVLIAAIAFALGKLLGLLPKIPAPGNYLLIALSATLLVWIGARLLDRRRFRDFGFSLDKAWWRDFGFGLALGALLMSGIFLFEYAMGWVTITGTFNTPNADTSFAVAILSPLVLFLCVGYYEELLFRGYLLRNFAEGFNLRVIGARNAILLAVFVSSALFGLVHAGNPNATVISTINITLAGFFLAAGLVITRQMAIPIGLHISWNFFQGNVFAFPVSGTDIGSTSFIGIEQGGPALWTGGAFGPEAGIVGLIAMVIGLLAIIFWTGKFSGMRGIDPQLAAAPRKN